MDQNPFRYSSPVAPDELVDREAEAAALLTAAAEGNNSRLVAPRRFGKTSLLRAVLAEGENRGWVGVYVDFFGVVTLADIAERIERAYGDALRGPAARWFDGLRRTLKPTVRVGVPVAGIGAEVRSEPAATSLLERLALPRKVAERWDRRVLVVFDEFQGVLTAESGADAIIRSEIQHHADSASYVFAGSHVGMMHALFSDRRRAFYAQAQPVELPLLPPDATAEFVTERFTRTGRDVGPALGPLLDAARGHPQRTMLLAHALWDHTPAGGRADEERFAAAHTAVLRASLGELTVIWSTLPTGQRRVLTALAAGEAPYSRGGSGGGSKGGAVRTALDALMQRGDVVRDRSVVPGYRIVDPLLASWVRAGRPDDL